MLYARKKITSGDMREVYYYPVLSNGKAFPGTNNNFSNQDKMPTSEAQLKAQSAYNKKKASDNLCRMVNANFNEGDLFCTAPFSDGFAMPKTYDEARKVFNAYIRRVNRWRAKNGLDKARYCYVIEEQERKRGEHKGEKMYHFHFFMSKMSRDVAEDLWAKEGRMNADRYQPWRFGQEAAARYMAKAPKGAKKYVCSRNCKKPVVSEPVIMEISNRVVERMANERFDDSEYWNRQAPGYQFIQCESLFNERNNKYYIRVVYRRNIRQTKKYKRKGRVNDEETRD